MNCPIIPVIIFLENIVQSGVILEINSFKHTLTHTQLFNGPWSGITQKKHSPIQTHEEEGEGFAQTTRSSLSQRGLTDPVKSAYNQSWLDGWLRLTASAFI